MQNTTEENTGRANELRDFPCLYFMDTYATHDEQARLFGCLAALHGKTIREAASCSLLFGHTTGLFSGKGLTPEELENHAGAYFDSPPSECRQLYRQAAIKRLGLRDRCCAVCERSVSYANARIVSERTVLKSLLEGRRDAYALNPTPDSFRSLAPISCDCRNGFLPAVPFNRLLFQSLTEGGLQLDEAELAGRIRESERDALLFTGDSVIRSFISLELRQIDGVPGYSATNIAPSVLRINAPYSYRPPKLALPEGASRPDRVKKAGEAGRKLKAGSRTIPPTTAGTQLTFGSLIPTIQPDGNATCTSRPDKSTDTSHPTDMALKPQDKKSGESMPDDIPDRPAAHSIGNGTDRAKAATKRDREGREDEDAWLYASVPAKLPKEAADMLQGWRNHFLLLHSLLPFCLPERHAPIVPYSGACTTCHEARSCSATDLMGCPYGALPMYHYARSCHAGNTVPGHPAWRPAWGRGGCAFSPGDTGCHVFGERAWTIPAHSLPYVTDCSGMQTGNAAAFLTEACSSHHIPVEHAIYDGVDGLLFLVAGKYYFFSPHCGTVGFLRPLLSDAIRTRFYSMNPIPVHACLLRMGFRHVRVESVAAFHSTAVGINALLPPGCIFRPDGGTAHLGYPMCAMPQYPESFQDSFRSSVHANRRRYEQKVRLERALGHADDLSPIAKGQQHCVQGGNFLSYLLTFTDLRRLTEPGCLLTVCLRDGSHSLGGWELLDLWEDVAGRVASASAGAICYSYLLSLSCAGIAYYSSYDTSYFYDILMDTARAACRDAIGPDGGVPDIVVRRERFS